MRVKIFAFIMLIALIVCAGAVSNETSTTYLNVWNDGPKTIGENVTFYANFSNFTSKQSITGAICNISFSDENSSLVLNELIYRYKKIFSLNGTYYYNVLCYKEGYDQLSILNNVIIIPIVNISLISPVNNSLYPYRTAIFNFSINDSIGMKNATLYGNFSGVWGANASNNVSISNNSISINISEGTYLWNIYVCNNLNVCNFFSQNLTFNFKIASPEIELVSPSDDDTIDSSNSVEFIYSVSDYYGIINCSLYKDGERVDTDTSVSTSTQNSFTQTLENGGYSWFVRCINEEEKSSDSSTYQVNIDYEEELESSTISSSESESLTNDRSSKNTTLNKNSSALNLTTNLTKNQTISNINNTITGKIITDSYKLSKGKGIGLFILAFFLTGIIGIVAYEMILRYGFKKSSNIFEPARKIGDEEDRGFLPENEWESGS